jgi:hypothetical protein
MNALIGAVAGRARELVVRPQATWATIAGEAHDAQQLLVGWVLPLAAIPAIARLLNGLLFGRLPFGRVVSQTIGHLILDVGMIVAVAWLVAWLAPRFGGQARYERALAWSAYAATPGLLAGVFQLVPGLAVLQLAGQIYGLYLGYLGLAPMLRSRADQSALFLLAIVAVTVVAMVLLSPLLKILLR